MKIVFLVSILTIFSLIGTSFALTPVYYSENKCDISKDLKNYRELLKDDIVIKAFLQKYPDAISIPSSTIDDSGGQISIQYKHEDETSKVQLTVQIIGYRETTQECFVPFSHVLNYSEHGRHLLIDTYEDQTQEIFDFLNGIKNQSPIMFLSNSSYSAIPIIIDQFRYYIPYKISGSTISRISPNCTIDTLHVYLDSSSHGKLTIAIPRNVLDAKEGNTDIDFIVLLDDEEASFKEIHTDSEFRMLEIQLDDNSGNLEIIASSTVATNAVPNCGIKETPQYQILLTPLQQFKSGIKADEITCKQGLELVIKSEHRHHPMCVKPSTKSKMFQMGLALPIRIAGLSGEIVQ